MTLPAEKFYLYVIGPLGGPHKIGISVDPAERMKELQIGSHHTLILKRSKEISSAAARGAEKRAHACLEEYAIRGEWFDVSEEQAWVALTRAVARQSAHDGIGRKSAPVPDRRRSGRPMLWPDKIIAALPAGTIAEIERVLAPGETKTDLLRRAILCEIERRIAAVPLEAAP